MIPYALAEIFTTEEYSDYTAARAMVSCAPNRIDNEWVRCHELARAVYECLPLASSARWRVVDGTCHSVDHTWLATMRNIVLDVYTPGAMPPVQLRDLPFIGKVYRPGFVRTDIREAVVAELVRVMAPAVSASPDTTLLEATEQALHIVRAQFPKDVLRPGVTFSLLPMRETDHSPQWYVSAARYPAGRERVVLASCTSASPLDAANGLLVGLDRAVDNPIKKSTRLRVR